MEDDAPIIDAPFIRDLEEEDRMQAIIYATAAGPNSDGEETDEEDGEDFSAKCLNDSGGLNQAQTWATIIKYLPLLV